MATINGQFTVTFTANESANSADYVISGATSATGSLAISCTAPIPGPCSFTIPVTYDTPSCDELTLEVTIYSDCDPDNTITQTQTFPLDGGCTTYKIKCTKAPEGCEGFNTTAICPDCPQYPLVQSMNVDTTTSVTPSNPALNEVRDFVPTGTELFFCYSDIIRISQELDPNQWSIEPYDDTDKCCWECRMYSFVFDNRESSYSSLYNPPFPPGIRFLPDVYPMIIATECSSEYDCYTPFKETINPALYINNTIPPVQVCLRKNSYTLIGNKYPVSVIDMGPCTI